MKMITFTLFKRMVRPTRLDKEEGHHQLGETVKGFIYSDMNRDFA